MPPTPSFLSPLLSHPRLRCPPLRTAPRCTVPLTPSDHAHIFSASPYTRALGNKPTAPPTPPAPPAAPTATACATSLSALFSRLATDTRDDPLAAHGGRVVAFRGSPTARLVVVGEAPGADEDRLQKPFVGRAGKLLDAIFRYAGFDLQRQLYITNVVKRRPPGNRTPTAEEVEFWMPVLREELEIVKPCIVVTAGATASAAVLGEGMMGISKVRGKWMTLERLGMPHVLVMPVFHPSYLLRNNSKKRYMVDDIHAIRDKYLQLCPGEVLEPLTPQNT